MQIQITFTCRECGLDQELRTDTSNYGVLSDDITNVALILDGSRQDLRCSNCGHVSRELGLGYRFREEHRPSHDHCEPSTAGA